MRFDISSWIQLSEDSSISSALHMVSLSTLMKDDYYQIPDWPFEHSAGAAVSRRSSTGAFSTLRPGRARELDVGLEP